MENSGISRLGEAVVCDLHDLAVGPMVSLVEGLNVVLRPLVRPSTGLPPDLRDRQH